jgi:hypothetical protein
MPGHSKAIDSVLNSKATMNTTNAQKTPDKANMSSANVSNRHELFLLGEGEKKITEEADTRKFSITVSLILNPIRS